MKFNEKIEKINEILFNAHSCLSVNKITVWIKDIVVSGMSHQFELLFSTVATI